MEIAIVGCRDSCDGAEIFGWAGAFGRCSSGIKGPWFGLTNMMPVDYFMCNGPWLTISIIHLVLTFGFHFALIVYWPFLPGFWLVILDCRYGFVLIKTFALGASIFYWVSDVILKYLWGLLVASCIFTFFHWLWYLRQIFFLMINVFYGSYLMIIKRAWLMRWFMLCSHSFEMGWWTGRNYSLARWMHTHFPRHSWSSYWDYNSVHFIWHLSNFVSKTYSLDNFDSSVTNL